MSMEVSIEGIQRGMPLAVSAFCLWFVWDQCRKTMAAWRELRECDVRYHEVAESVIYDLRIQVEDLQSQIAKERGPSPIAAVSKSQTYAEFIEQKQREVASSLGVPKYVFEKPSMLYEFDDWWQWVLLKTKPRRIPDGLTSEVMSLPLDIDYEQGGGAFGSSG